MNRHPTGATGATGALGHSAAGPKVTKDKVPPVLQVAELKAIKVKLATELTGAAGPKGDKDATGAKR